MREIISTYTLIRHAETPYNADLSHIIQGKNSSVELSPNGTLQAAKLSIRLMQEHPEGFDRVWSSTAVRSVITQRLGMAALRIHKLAPAETIFLEELEELSQGEWEGQLRTAIYNNPAVQADIAARGLDFKAPGGTSLREAGDEMRSTLNYIDSFDPTSNRHCIFTHGLKTRTLVGDILGWSRDEIIHTQLGNTQESEIVRLANNELVVTKFNGERYDYAQF